MLKIPSKAHRPHHTQPCQQNYRCKSTLAHLLGVFVFCTGFITDPKLIAQSGMSDPRPFFVSLLSRPYLNNVVISPHYYPPSISHATSQLSILCTP